MLNEQRSPLRDEDAADEAARVLSATRAQQLALRGLPHDQVADRLAHELQRARECADRNAAQLHEIEELHARTPWYRRGERAQLDVRRASGTSGVVHWDAEVRRLEQDIADRPPVLEPQLWRAIDPLPDRGHGLDRAPGAHELPQFDLGRDIGHDVGIDL